jgi:putative transposase
VTAYRIISAEKASGVPVSLACELLEVSRSGYYEWSTRAPSDRELTDAWLTEKIKQIHAENRGVYGSPRIHVELRMAHGVEVGRKRVERLMAQAGISGLVYRKRGRTTIRVQGVRVADDLVKRQFRPEEPDVLWIADFSYLRTWEGWLYLAAVQDAFSRRIVGWCMADHMREELVIDALTMAVRRRRPDPGVIHHSDQGSQGEFNRSSQRLIEEGCDGQAEGVGVGPDGAAGDAVAGAAAGGAPRASAAVLGGDRARRDEPGGGRGGGRVGRGWCPMVSRGWRHADCHSGPAVWAVLELRRAGGDRALACNGVRGARDLPSAWSLTVGDLA